MKIHFNAATTYAMPTFDHAELNSVIQGWHKHCWTWGSGGSFKVCRAILKQIMLQCNQLKIDWGGAKLGSWTDCRDCNIKIFCLNLCVMQMNEPNFFSELSWLHFEKDNNSKLARIIGNGWLSAWFRTVPRAVFTSSRFVWGLTSLHCMQKCVQQCRYDPTLDKHI